MIAAQGQEQEKPLVTNQEQDDYTNDRYCIMKSQHGCPPGEGELGWSDSCQCTLMARLANAEIEHT